MADKKEPAEVVEKPTEKAAEVSKPEHVMAPGKAITTKKGIVGEGEEITAEMLAGGKGAFNSFLKSKHIMVNK